MWAAMLEGLPPNNAAHVMRLVSDERRARSVADLIVESFEPAEAASTAFETDDLLPGGGKAWLVEAYFGWEPDEETIRELIAVASDEATALAATSPNSATFPSVGQSGDGTNAPRSRK